jgi:hypothetical protein
MILFSYELTSHLLDVEDECKAKVEMLVVNFGKRKTVIED